MAELVIEEVTLFVTVDDDVFWRRNQTVFYSAVTAQRILICACMEETNVQRFRVGEFVVRKQQLLVEVLSVVVVGVVTADAADVDSLVLVVPFVDGLLTFVL